MPTSQENIPKYELLLLVFFKVFSSITERAY
jgi:hypothetical protein